MRTAIPYHAMSFGSSLTMRSSEQTHRHTFHRLGFIVCLLCAQRPPPGLSLSLGRRRLGVSALCALH